MTTVLNHITPDQEVSGFDSRAIANALLLKSREKYGLDKLTAMQLIKLVYLAHGWSLALLREPIVSRRPQAWQFGPVYPHIYKKVKGRGSTPIRDLIKDGEGNAYYPHGITPQQDRLLDDILLSYGDMAAFNLSAITHKEGTPWDFAQKNLGLYQDIPEDVMKAHFEQLRDDRGIDDARYATS